jgi:phage tail-like protein
VTAEMNASPYLPDLSDAAPKLLSLAVDRYNCYPGEQVQYYLRFAVPAGQTPEEPLAGSLLQFAMPKVLSLDSCRLSDGALSAPPTVREEGQDRVVTFSLAPDFKPGRAYEMILQVGLNTFYFNQYLSAEARILTPDGTVLASEEIQVAVYSKGSYLKYLPELYESDDFMGRFLILFESFWKPIAQQIDQIETVFDPSLTPPEFVPWLASWIGMPVDEALPLPRMRALIKSAMMFYQCRGTGHALRTYLEIYTSGQVDIVEWRARNFVLGATTVLGVESALGIGNHPNSLSVRARIPAAELERTQYTEAMYRQKITDIVRWMVPAHVAFDVKCEFEPELSIPDKRI